MKSILDMNRIKFKIIFLILLSIFLSSCVSLNDIAVGETNQLYECSSKNLIQICPGDLSSGKQTRCYLDINRLIWDYCSSGWIQYEEPIEIVNNDCTKVRLCTKYKDYDYDRDCFYVSYNEMIKLCSLTEDKEFCVHNKNAYQVECDV